MQITISNEAGPTAKVGLVGRLDIAGAEVIALPLATLSGGKTNVIVDMSGVTFVASIGIRDLVSRRCYPAAGESSCSSIQ
jgi:anti-anti-sigma regulatory factor